MKHIIILSLLLLVSCYAEEEKSIIVNLDDRVASIQYSQFAKSLDYIKLEDDSCLISEIERIYMDGDTICLLDRKKGGIFVYTSQGKLVSNINYYGKGPQEFRDVSAFSIDPHLNQICVYDMGSMKINKYSYSGQFIKSYDTDVYVWDFVVLKDEKNLFVHPYYARKVKYGIWMTDSLNHLLKDFPLDIPEDDQFVFFNTHFNRRGDELFYYDRIYDRMMYITSDTLYTLYSFDLKQRLSDELRVKDPATYRWENFAMMWNFSMSEDCLLMNYYYYEQENPYRWVFLNRKTNQLVTSEYLVNDIDSIQSDSRSIFYLNDKLWCRTIDSDENDNCDILLQLIHL